MVFCWNQDIEILVDMLQSETEIFDMNSLSHERWNESSTEIKNSEIKLIHH